MLYPPGQPPFSVQIDHLFADFEWSAGSALTTMIGMAAVTVCYALGNLLLKRVLAPERALS